LHSKEGICFVAERGEKIYTKDGTPLPMFGAKAIFGVLENIPTDNVPKVFLPASENDPQIVLALMEELQQKFPRLHVIKTAHKEFLGLDINDGGVSKHLAMLEYSRLTNLDPKEIIGVGDSYNDYPLLSACGYKVAMGNAPKELIELADKIVGTQKEDGIIEVFELVK
jgi:hydroxymethylpyrimidine pyrophosphatase-like HAD family hydrolase